MTNGELEAEYEAINSEKFKACFTDENISQEIKSDLFEHMNEVIQEKKFRDGETAFYPVMTFGFFDL